MDDILLEITHQDSFTVLKAKSPIQTNFSKSFGGSGRGPPHHVKNKPQMTTKAHGSTGAHTSYFGGLRIFLGCCCGLSWISHQMWRGSASDLHTTHHRNNKRHGVEGVRDSPVWRRLTPPFRRQLDCAKIPSGGSTLV